MRHLAAEQRQPLIARLQLREHGDDQGDDRHAGKQEQQLLQPDPGAVLFVAGQQELHGGPLDALVAHHVDQMDQHWQDCQQKAADECLMDELHE
jgi:hypothetical protein